MEVNKELHAIDEADLEDGEIETDEESEIIEPTPPAQPATSTKEKTASGEGETKKAKISSDEEVSLSKKASSKHSKGEHHHRKSSSKATNNGGSSGCNSNNKKNATESSSSVKKPTDGNF